VRAELLFGARKSTNPGKARRKVSQFLLPYDVAPFDEPAAGLYADIRADLEGRGQPIGPNDLIIAATVLSREGTLITHNVSEFGRVKGLDIEDWCQD
jgi:tRNA(fMet)-specific endonuclease VapC